MSARSRPRQIFIYRTRSCEGAKELDAPRVMLELVWHEHEFAALDFSCLEVLFEEKSSKNLRNETIYSKISNKSRRILKTKRGQF